MSAFSGFLNIGKVPELRRRVLFTLGMLAVYRVGVFVTIPGVDRNVMQAVMQIMNAPPEQFLEPDSSRDVNTAP